MRRPAAFLFLVLAGCGGGTGEPSNGVPATPLGADISALERIEQGGAVFRSDGKAADAVTLLHDHGFSLFRLRLFVNPSHQDVEVNDLAYTLRMATRIKAVHARFLLDLHFSDTWADPGHQTPPAAWAGLSLPDLESRIESYSAGVIQQLKQAGALPDLVQVGNEIDAGLLWPSGRVGGAFDTPVQWDQLTRLLKASIRGIRSALAAGDNLKIMLHYSNGGSTAGVTWFLDHIDAAAVPYDVVGLSYYPWWHGSFAELSATLRTVASRTRDVMVVETSYPWRAGGWETMATNRAAMVWSVDPIGQYVFLHDLVSTVAATPGGHGAGVVWWYPEAVAVPGLFVWGGGSLALFDPSGAPLRAVDALQPY